VKVIFVSYGLFESNSGGHIAGFANELAKNGHSVAVCAAGPSDNLSVYGPTHFTAIPVEAIEDDPQSVAAFDGKAADPGETIIHCWTPREKVRILTETLRRELPAPYVVHLEDNEELVTASQMQESWGNLMAADIGMLDAMIPLALSHPLRYKRFLAAGAGATVIVDTLGDFVPTGLPVHVLEPGVNSQKFAPAAKAADRTAVLAKLGINPKAKVIVYHGNMHAANQREVFSLYCAVNILRRRGLDVHLLRAGRDYSPGVDVSFDTLKGAVTELGFLDDAFLLEVLKTADAYVQPGGADAFNIYRLPSKLPEFLALGRPVLLPSANIGRQLMDGVEAIVLQRGDGTEIADRLMAVFEDKELAKALGQGGRLYAKKNLDWAYKARGLQDFYDRILRENQTQTERQHA
jgi:glycosyltransferase involved in cell wall biosynthesis